MTTEDSCTDKHRTIQPENIMLRYRDDENQEHFQKLTDLLEVGPLIYENTDEEMELVDVDLILSDPKTDAASDISAAQRIRRDFARDLLAAASSGTALDLLHRVADQEDPATRTMAAESFGIILEAATQWRDELIEHIIPGAALSDVPEYEATERTLSKTINSRRG